MRSLRRNLGLQPEIIPEDDSDLNDNSYRQGSNPGESEEDNDDLPIDDDEANNSAGEKFDECVEEVMQDANTSEDINIDDSTFSKASSASESNDGLLQADGEWVEKSICFSHPSEVTFSI